MYALTVNWRKGITIIHLPWYLVFYKHLNIWECFVLFLNTLMLRLIGVMDVKTVTND